MDATVCLAALSDDELLARLRTLSERDGRLTAALLAHLGEVDARRLHLREACPSLFVYCRDVLHVSEDVAFKRIRAARAARRFPVILELVASGAIHLAALKLLAPHLTHDNHRELLAAASHKSKRAVEQLVADRFPQADVPDRLRKLPTPTPAPTATPALLLPAAVANPERAPGPVAMPPVLPPPRSSPRPAVVAPLSPARYQVQFTADQALRDKLVEAQALLRHQIPDGDFATVFDRALTLLVADLRRRRCAQTDRPQAASRRTTAPDSRHVPAAITRDVWERDGAQCTFVSADGRRCPERGFLEIHHERSFALGGPTTLDNLTLRCRSHNAYAAEQVFGREVMDHHRGQPGA